MSFDVISKDAMLFSYFIKKKWKNQLISNQWINILLYILLKLNEKYFFLTHSFGSTGNVLCRPFSLVLLGAVASSYLSSELQVWMYV